MSDLLSQEEIDALLNGVDDGKIETESDIPPPPGTVLDFDFTQQDRIVRGRLPTLEMINDRFARFFRTALFGVLRKTCEVSVLGVKMLKFSEYVHGLAVPSNLNLMRLKLFFAGGVAQARVGLRAEQHHQRIANHRIAVFHRLNGVRVVRHDSYAHLQVPRGILIGEIHYESRIERQEQLGLFRCFGLRGRRFRTVRVRQREAAAPQNQHGDQPHHHPFLATFLLRRRGGGYNVLCNVGVSHE